MEPMAVVAASSVPAVVALLPRTRQQPTPPRLFRTPSWRGSSTCEGWVRHHQHLTYSIVSHSSAPKPFSHRPHNPTNHSFKVGAALRSAARAAGISVILRASLQDALNAGGRVAVGSIVDHVDGAEGAGNDNNDGCAGSAVEASVEASVDTMMNTAVASYPPTDAADRNGSGNGVVYGPVPPWETKVLRIRSLCTNISNFYEPQVLANTSMLTLY